MVEIKKGNLPDRNRKAWQECQCYQEGEAARVTGANTPEEWLAVVEKYEPSAQKVWQLTRQNPDLNRFIKGRVLDLGAGTCWLSGELTKIETISEVYPLDLSEKFLEEVGLKVIKHVGGNLDKLKSFLIPRFLYPSQRKKHTTLQTH